MITIQNAQKNYKDFRLDCSLNVPKGYISGIVGSNGAGKTTVFKLLLDLVALEGGSIKIFGKEVIRLSAKDKEKIGIVLSDMGFSEYLNVNDIARILASTYANFDRQKFATLCSKFELPLNKKVLNFSSGMKAKLKTIIAITHGAKVLLLDEVTTGLDVMARNELLSLLHECMEEDEERSILISSHISSDLENLCDDLYIIKEGRIIFHETLDALSSDYAVLKLNDAQYQRIDKSYILSQKKEPYGFLCLTDERQYYVDNYPDVVIEKSTIDELMVIMNGGEQL